MLKPGFLQKLNDWVVGEYLRHPDILSKANKEFGMDKYFELRANSEIDQDYSPCFTEFLTFDYKPKFLNHLTGLEYFCKSNPLNISGQEFEGYKDLLNFEVGIFNINKIVHGRGFYINSLIDKKEILVEDVSISMENISTPARMWMRVCRVNDVWSVVSATALQLPIFYYNGNLQNNERASLKSMFKLMLDKSKANDVEDKEKISMVEAKKLFTDIREKLGISSLFTLEQFEKWARDEEVYGVNFCIKVLYYVMPEDLEGNGAEEYFNIGSDYLNSVTKFYNSTKNIYERFREGKTGPGVFDVNIYDRNMVGRQQESAADSLYVGNYKKSIAQYKKLVTELFKAKTPTFPVFRIYANSANAYLASGDYKMAYSLLLASLRINKKYTFAKSNLERTLKILKDEEKSSLDDITYNKTIYAKYEKFIVDTGIDFTMDVTVKINNFKII